jgi:hypothetical protein
MTAKTDNGRNRTTSCNCNRNDDCNDDCNDNCNDNYNCYRKRQLQLHDNRDSNDNRNRNCKRCFPLY